MTWVNLLFTAGALTFLVGLALVDYRLSMVVGGALAMLFAWYLGKALISHRNTTQRGGSAP